MMQEQNEKKQTRLAKPSTKFNFALHKKIIDINFALASDRHHRLI